MEPKTGFLKFLKIQACYLIATSHKHCAFTGYYLRSFCELEDPFVIYTVLMRPRNLKTAPVNKIQRRQLARSGVSPGVLLHEAFRPTIFSIGLRDKARYQRAHIYIKRCSLNDMRYSQMQVHLEKLTRSIEGHILLVKK